MRQCFVFEDFNVIQVNTSDWAGGAERISFSLFSEYKKLGFHSTLAVGYKHLNDPDIVVLKAIGKKKVGLRRCVRNIAKIMGIERSYDLVTSAVSHPSALLHSLQGREYFNYPESHKITNLLGSSPTILHLHNLHGEYFDLTMLPGLTRKVPVVITLHDAWLLSGHCAHSLDCERWRTGCGSCPYLDLPPAVKRDNTDRNWKRKKLIFSRCDALYAVTPCQWLKEKVVNSLLSSALREVRVISNGVDLDIFKPGDREAARHALGLPQDAFIMLFVANGLRNNKWKDYPLLVKALRTLPSNNKSILGVGLGDTAADERIGVTQLSFVPFTQDIKRVALYYQAADIYVHPARVDTFPNSILESLACGLPVVATSVGGIPEQVNSIHLPAISTEDCHKKSEAPTGILVPADAERLSAALAWCINHETELKQVSENCAKQARDHFGLELSARRYIEFYREILQERANTSGQN